MTDLTCVTAHGVEMLASERSRGSRHDNTSKVLHYSRHENVAKLQHEPHEQSGANAGVDGLSYCRGPCRELSTMDMGMYLRKKGEGGCRRALLYLFRLLPLSSSNRLCLRRRRLGPAAFCLCNLCQARWAALQMTARVVNYACRRFVALLQVLIALVFVMLPQMMTVVWLFPACRRVNRQVDHLVDRRVGSSCAFRIWCLARSQQGWLFFQVAAVGCRACYVSSCP